MREILKFSSDITKIILIDVQVLRDCCNLQTLSHEKESSVKTFQTKVKNAVWKRTRGYHCDEIVKVSIFGIRIFKCLNIKKDTVSFHKTFDLLLLDFKF